MSMKILVCDPVDDVVVDHFSRLDHFSITEVFQRDEIKQEIEDAHFLIVRSGTSVDTDLLDHSHQLVGIVRAGVGLDSIDLDYAEQQSIQVQNTPEASTNAVAELVIGHILNLYRKIHRGDSELKDGNWIKSQLSGREIQGKTVGIIGYGRIGERVGQLVQAFGADVLGFDKLLSDDEIEERGGNPTTLDTIIETADILTVHVPLTDATRNLIGEDEVHTLKDNAILINCSRGGVYDEEALSTALETDQLYGVGLDTFVDEPPGQSNIVTSEKSVVTPHIGASTTEAQERIGQLVIEKIESMATVKSSD